MRTEVKQLHLQLGTTSILVTHDQEEAMTMSDVIAVMREGRLVQFGSQHEIYRRPANIYVATFVGKPRMSLLEGRLEERDGVVRFVKGDVTIALGAPKTLGITGAVPDAVVLGLRAEDVRILPGRSKAAGAFEATVELLEPIGSDTFVKLVVGDDRLTARTSPDHELSIGQRVSAEVRGQAHLFDPVSTNRIA
jgi:multiple sugar transport system ATP-binding protein